MNWTNKRVFITGGTGFLGTHLCNRLEKEATSLGLFIHVTESPKNARKIHGDLAEYTSDLSHFLQKFKPEIIFHLASQPLVSVAMLDELETMQTNVAGTYNLLHACKDIGSIKSFVHISTDKVYGNVSPINRNTIPAGIHHPYNASKLASDAIAQMYSSFFGVPMVIIRNANIYGAGDTHFDRIIPRTIRQALKDEQPVIRGDGSNTRDYIHVDDLIEGYLRAAELPYDKPLSIINLGGFNYSVRQVVDAVLEEMNRVDLPAHYEPQWKGEIPHQNIINDIAKELIDWNPKINLGEGLKKTVPWYVGKYGQS